MTLHDGHEAGATLAGHRPRAAMRAQRRRREAI